MNAKLANSIFQASSWTVRGAASKWLDKNGTLVIGYAFAGGKSSVTVSQSVRFRLAIFDYLGISNI